MTVSMMTMYDDCRRRVVVEIAPIPLGILFDHYHHRSRNHHVCSRICLYLDSNVQWKCLWSAVSWTGIDAGN